MWLGGISTLLALPAPLPKRLGVPPARARRRTRHLLQPERGALRGAQPEGGRDVRGVLLDLQAENAEAPMVGSV